MRSDPARFQRLPRWALLIVGLMPHAGCERPKPSMSPPPTEKVSILATVYPLADVARQIGGRHVNVTWIIEGGQSITGVMPDADARNRLRTSELVLLGGATEPWADIGVGDPMQHSRILRMDLLDPTSTILGLLWLDPVAVRNTCREMHKRLRVLRPQLDREFEDRTNDFVAKLDGVIEDYHPKFKDALIKKVLVLSTDFNPLLIRFGLQPIQPVAALPMALDDSMIRALKQASGQNLTRVLLVPIDTPAAIARDLEVRGGFQVVRIDPLGSSAAGGHNSYLSVLRFNLEQLLNATAVR